MIKKVEIKKDSKNSKPIKSSKNKSSLKSIKKNNLISENYIFKEINSLLELEVKKLKSELSSKQIKDKNEISFTLSNFEKNLLELIKKQKFFEKKENSQLNKLSILSQELKEELKEELGKVLISTDKKIQKLGKFNNKDYELLNSSIEKHETLILNLSKNISKLKSEIKKINFDEQIDLSSLVSKMKNIDKEISSMKYLFDKLEGELLKHKSFDTKLMETKIKAFFKKFNINLNELSLNQEQLKNDLFEKTKDYFNSEGLKLVNDFMNSKTKKDNLKLQNDLNIRFKELKLIIDLKLNESISEFSKDREKIELNIQKIKNEFLKNVKDYIEQLDIELKTLKKENIHFEKKNNSYVKKIDLKVQKYLADIDSIIKENNFRFEKEIKNIQIEKIKQRDYLAEKYNELVSVFENLKKDNGLLIKSAKQNLDLKFNSELSKITKQVKENISSEILSNKNYLMDLSKQNQQDQKKMFEMIESKLVKSKLEFENEIKTKLKDFNYNLSSYKTNYLDSLNSLEDKYNIKIQSINEILDSKKNDFLNTIKTLEESQTLSLKKLNSDLDSKKSDFLNTIKTLEESQTLSLKKLNSDLDSKKSDFLNTIKTLEETASDKIAEMNINFEEKINIILKDFEKIRNEKEETKNDLVKFKVEISNLTKDYTKNLDNELKKLRVEELQFEDKKNDILTEIYNFSKTKQVQLNEYSLLLEQNLKDVIHSEKEQFERNENAFREIFSKKIRNLEIGITDKLKIIETKFLEKNIKEIETKLSQEIKVINLLEEKLDAKINLIERKSEILEAKENDFQLNLDSEKNLLKEKVETRLMDLEKQLNKRFLDLDSKFTTFKSVVVEEVEDLMLEVENIVKTKVNGIDQRFTKLNFINNEATNKLSQLSHQNQRYDAQYSDIMDELNDIKIKLHLNNNNYSLNEHISYMKIYEEQLIGLIRNLKKRGITDNAIQNALSQKGHPSFYVKMILVDFDKFYD